MIKRKPFDESAEACETSGKFGSATFATPQDFIPLNAYQSDNGIFIGTDT